MANEAPYEPEPPSESPEPTNNDNERELMLKFAKILWDATQNPSPVPIEIV